MTIVLVHGVPETSLVWRPMAGGLTAAGHDVVCLSPPGFGAPVPPGFGATRLEYAAWLVGELERVGHPVHLVGHDWGGAHALTVAMKRPDLLCSWCIDTAGLMHPDYVWHDMARVWQTAEAGEKQLTEWRAAAAEARRGLFTSVGMDGDDARDVARALDADMAACILALYRSARQPAMATAGLELSTARARPGLVIVADHDPFVGTPQMATDVAVQAGAHVAHLEGVGHWWMLQEPATGAALLSWFVDLVDGSSAG